MKKLFFLSILFISFYSQAQYKKENFEGLFYKISFATTLRINEEYQAFDDRDETLINPSAFFIENTLGYQFDIQTSIGFNLGYNWHSQQGLHFIPAYLSLRHNFIVDDTNIFARAGYGKLLSIGNSFESGNLYKFGLGIQVYGDSHHNAFLFGLDFTRKRFGYRSLEGLSSISIFFEFIL